MCVSRSTVSIFPVSFNKSSVLPKELQKRMLGELNKRLDLDLDAILESPKLRLELSPAELDKKLLDFYTKVSDGPSGDILRMIGGGTSVGRQDLYMKQQARKKRKGSADRFTFPDVFPDLEDIDERERTTTQWVKLALSRALPSKSKSSFSFAEKKATSLRAKNQDSTKMSFGFPSLCRSYQPITTAQTIRFGSTPAMRPPRSTTSSLLI